MRHDRNAEAVVSERNGAWVRSSEIAASVWLGLFRVRLAAPGPAGELFGLVETNRVSLDIRGVV